MRWKYWKYPLQESWNKYELLTGEIDSGAKSSTDRGLDPETVDDCMIFKSFIDYRGSFASEKKGEEDAYSIFRQWYIWEKTQLSLESWKESEASEHSKDFITR